MFTYNNCEADDLGRIRLCTAGPNGGRLIWAQLTLTADRGPGEPRPDSSFETRIRFRVEFMKLSTAWSWFLVSIGTAPSVSLSMILGV